MMSKTYELRKVIKSLLNESDGESYPNQAMDNVKFPYKTYSLDNVQLGDEADRNDYLLYIDIFDYSTNSKVVEKIADDIEVSFNRRNTPNEKIYPTFYLSTRRQIVEEDKRIKHIQLIIETQMYN